MTHHLDPDGIDYPDGITRCRSCGLPKPNRVHDVPDTTDQQTEHRRRAGESEQQ